MIDDVKNKVYELLKNENSGHGCDHIERVVRLSVAFAEKEGADKEIVSLIALLHDVDDYKIFGKENAANLTNANSILDQCGASADTKDRVISAIKKIGFKKRLSGIQPDTIEGMIVSDADMCDATGADGIIRAHSFTVAHNGTFFDRNTFPSTDDGAYGETDKLATAVNHVFEKLLRLKSFMLTESGKQEATKRQQIMIDFLRNFFEEEDAPEWIEYLDDYLLKNGLKNGN